VGVVSQGSLAEWSAPRLFAALAGRGFSGELIIESAGKDYRVGWSDGAVVGARSPHPADSAAKVAVTLGVLSSTQAGEVARLLASSPGHDEVAIVAQVARLGSELVERLARRVAGARAARALWPETGTFTVVDEVPFWASVPPVDARWVLYTGLRTHLPLERMARDLTALGTMVRLREGADLGGFGFGENERPVIDRLLAGELEVAPPPDDIDAHIATAVALALVLTREATVFEPAPSAIYAAVPAKDPAPSAEKPATPKPAPAAPKPPARAVRKGVANAEHIRTLVAERLALLDRGADHFTLLGLSQDSPPEAVRARYFELARHLHPDRLEAAGVDDVKKDAQRLFARMNEAFATLADPARRQAYTAVVRAGGEAAIKAREAATEAAVRKALEAEERFRLGEMALRRQQMEIAVREFERALELDPEESDHHAMLGWAVYVAAPNKAAVLPIARGHLLRAADKNRKNPMPHLYLGRIARMEGNDAEAEQHLKKALELAPGQADAAAELRAVEARRAASRPADKPGFFTRLKKP
jgi:tetratricopeptide (TPR) repeat protein